MSYQVKAFATNKYRPPQANLLNNDFFSRALILASQVKDTSLSWKPIMRKTTNFGRDAESAQL